MEKTFSVIEYSSFFAIHHNETGQERHVGDGVDTLFDSNDKAFNPGTPGFVETWENALNASENEIMEAYFPELLEAEMSIG